MTGGVRTASVGTGVVIVALVVLVVAVTPTAAVDAEQSVADRSERRHTIDDPGGHAPAVTNATPVESAPTVEVKRTSVAVDGSTTISLRLSRAPDGVAGYAIDVRLANGSVADITAATAGSSFRPANAKIDPSGDTVRFVAGDFDGNVSDGATDVSLGTLTVTGVDPGETKLDISIVALDNDDGDRIRPVQADGYLAVTRTAMVTVAADGSGDYRSIQAAVDNVSAGYTVRVEPGVYREGVTLDKNVTLVAPSGATLTAAGTTDVAGITIPSDSAVAPTVDGFTIRGFRTGVRAGATHGDWTIRNTVIRNTRKGVNAGTFQVAPATGDWRLHNVTITAAASDSVGVLAASTPGNWTITDSVIREGVRATGADGDWAIRRSTLTNPSDSLYADALSAESTSGDWLVANSTITNGQLIGVDARQATGDWTIRDSAVVDNADDHPVNAEQYSNVGGIRATGTSGGWAVVNSTVSHNGVNGVYARRATGNWTITGTLIATNERAGIDAVGATAGRIRDSAFVRNDGPAVNGTDVVMTVDATQNWWGDADGPDAGQCVGNVTCTQARTSAPAGLDVPRTLVVAPDGGGDFTSIQAAVDAAETGARIVVRNGTYTEAVTLDTELTLVAAHPGHVTLDGTGIDTTAGVTIGRSVDPTIRGIRITDFEVGVDAAGTAAEWRLRDVIITNTSVGVRATDAAGGWTVVDSQITNNSVGVDATGSGEGWRIVGSTVVNNNNVGIRTQNGTYVPWVAQPAVHLSAITDNGVGLDATGSAPTVDATRNWWGDVSGPAPGQCLGNADCSIPLPSPLEQAGEVVVVDADGGGDYRSIQAAVENVSAGATVRVRAGVYRETVTLNKSIRLIAVTPGQVTLNGSGPPLNQHGITIRGDAAPTIEGFRITNYTLAVDAIESTGDWTLRDVTLQNSNAGVQAARSTGDWTVANATIAGNRFTGIIATDTSGAWTVRRTVVIANGATGIKATDADGNWTVRNATVVRNGNDAIRAIETSGDWTVASATLRANGRTGVDARSSRGAWRIVESVITANGGAGVNASATTTASAAIVNASVVVNNSAGVVANGTSPTVDATDNWWGNASGPAPEQCVGNVNCAEPLGSPPAGVGGPNVIRELTDEPNETKALPEPDIVVATDGSGNYTSIQAALDNASAGARIHVRSGTYREELTIEQNVTLVGVGDPVLNGSTLHDAAFSGDRATAIRVTENLSADGSQFTIAGFTIRNYSTGMDLRKASGPWTVRDVTISDSFVGLTAKGTAANWTVVDTTITGSFVAFDASDTSGAWRLVDSTVRKSFVAVSAIRSSGNWTITNTRVSRNLAGVAAKQSTGAWRITNSTITHNNVDRDGFGVQATNTEGAWTINNSSIHDNTVGVNATGASPAGDATDNWWGQAAGPTADQCVGSVDCSDALSRPPGPYLVVSKSGTGDYNSIQAAVNNASNGTYIFVESGAYHESVHIWKSVTLVTEDAVLDGSNVGKAPAIRIDEERVGRVTIRGFEIEDYQMGIAAFSVSAAVTVEDVTIRTNSKGVGISSGATNGPWTLRNVTIRGGDRGIVAGDSSGDWMLEDVTIDGSRQAVSSARADGDWTLRDVTVRKVYSVLSGWGTTGDWLLQDVTVRNASRGIFANGATGTWTVRDVSLGRNRSAAAGMTVLDSKSSWTVVDSVIGPVEGGNLSGSWRFRNATLGSLDAHDSTGYWTIRNSTMGGDGGMYFPNFSGTLLIADSVSSYDFIDLTRSDARVGLRNVSFNGTVGIGAENATSKWYIRDTSNLSVGAVRTDGYWSIENSTLTRLATTHSTATWEIRGSTITDRVHAVNTSGEWTITDSTVRSLDASRSAATWRLRQVKLTQGQIVEPRIDARKSTGDWTLTRVTITDADEGVIARNSTGDWSLSHVTIRSDEDLGTGISAVDSTGRWTIRASVIRAGDVSVAARRTSNAWTIRNSVILGNPDWQLGTGIDATSSDATWALRNTTIRGLEDAVLASRTTGTWTIRDSRINGSAQTIYAPNATGDWTVRNTLLDNFGSIEAASSEGDWTIRNVTLTHVDGSASTGNWIIRHSVLDGYLIGVDAQDVAGTWEIRRSSFVSNPDPYSDEPFYDVNAKDASPTVDAVRNWWGERGDDAPACTGNVDCDLPLGSPPGEAGANETVAGANESVAGADGESGSTASISRPPSGFTTTRTVATGSKSLVEIGRSVGME